MHRGALRGRPAPPRQWYAALLVAAALIAPGAGLAGNPDAVEASGEGILTKCRSWLVASSCRTYQHIELPERIAVGDTVTVAFGSHPKEFGFYVARITFANGRCTLLSEAEGDPEAMDKIEVARCRRAEPVR